MTEFIPIFPLQIVVFPGDDLNLHIFEPRYKQLIKECFKEDKSFGIPTFFTNKALNFGTEIQLINIEKTYEEGKMDIRSKGMRLFKIIKLVRNVKGKLYSGAEVEFIDSAGKADVTLAEDFLILADSLYHIMSVDKELPELGSDFLSYRLAHHVGLTLEQKFEVLKMTDENDRLKYLIKHLEGFIPEVKKMEELRRRIQMNGHFRELDPPEI